MLGFEITEQPPSKVIVNEIFSFAFHCPITSRSFSKILKTFTPNNSFATAKLVDLPTLEDIEDDTYILGCLRAQFSENVADRILRFEIGIRKPGAYKILISIHGKTSDWNTSVHYPVISDLWTDEIYVCVPTLWFMSTILWESKFKNSDCWAGQGTISAARYRRSTAAKSCGVSPNKGFGKSGWRGWEWRSSRNTHSDPRNRPSTRILQDYNGSSANLLSTDISHPSHDCRDCK